jgi:trimeric autotransporter adhesin
LVAVSCALAAGAFAQPLGTAFTYQGRLIENGSPASGAYDLELKLFDAPAAGAQVGPTLLRDDVPVAGGLFTVLVDFGAAFGGSARWLEIGVRAGASTGAFTTLPGRQELTPSPNALFSANAPWSGVTGKPAGFADDVDNDSGGDITAVNTAAGSGLSGGAATGIANLAVAFGGSGTASTVSRTDHQHLGQTWTAALNPGLAITSAAANGTVLNASATNLGGLTYGVRGGSTSSNGVGVFGEVTSSTGPTYAVLGHTHSSSGSAVYGIAIGTVGATHGVQGLSNATSGRGVFGHALASTGPTHGVLGQTDSAGNIFVTSGVTGHATHTSGVNFGVRGVSNSSAGIGVLGSTTATSGSAIGVWGRTDAIGGVGVLAESSAATNNSTALEIKNGKIKITGAGVGTPTPAFQIAAGADECAGGVATEINHPHANFNPGAIIMVTPVMQGSISIGLSYTASGFLDCLPGRWLVWHSDVEIAFNVLVMVP